MWATATAAEKTHQVLEEARTQLPTRALGWADQAWRYSATAGKTYREGLPRKTQEICNDQQGEADGEDQGVKVEARSKPSQLDPGKLDQPGKSKL